MESLADAVCDAAAGLAAATVAVGGENVLVLAGADVDAATAARVGAGLAWEG